MDATLTSAGLSPPADWGDSRGKLLEDTWLLTLFAALLATALPWFVSAFQIDFAAATWALLGLGVIYAALALVGNMEGASPATRRRLATLLHAGGIIALGFLWQRCGALQNPVFLVSFVLPVIGASALSRWHPYTSALLAVLVVLGVAIVQAPELRWYAGGVNGVDRWLSGLLGQALSNASGGGVFPGFYAPVKYDVVLLEVFAVLILACGAAAESLGNAFDKLLEHLRVARGDATRAQEMWARLVQQLPLPALLVELDTRQIILSSKTLAPFWRDDEALVGQPLFDVLKLGYPERLQEQLGAEGGAACSVMLHAGAELRMGRIHVRHLPFEGRRLALLLIEDISDTFLAAAALDAEEHAVLVINASGRVVVGNRTARALLPEVSVGCEASRVLSRGNGSSGAAPSRWWEPGLTGRRRLHVALARGAYLATCTAVALPGEAEAVYVVAFAPLLPAGVRAETVAPSALGLPG
ncbi:MAG TPA: hypothetical protein VHY19_03605 [Steroidobacteraceae bacterium]|jgi:PAS domain-containing protein|nr:hypothetical protein [Steroidobacteraceae bacterium]